MSTFTPDRTYYTAAELAELGGAWQDAGYTAILTGSTLQYRRGDIHWYAAFFTRYKRSVCLHAHGRDGRKRERYVALDRRMELVKRGAR